MKKDGRGLAHDTLEGMRVLAMGRKAEGEHPAEVAASLRAASRVGAQDTSAGVRWMPARAAFEQKHEPAEAGISRRRLETGMSLKTSVEATKPQKNH
jgi:hypothetical protein